MTLDRQEELLRDLEDNPLSRYRDLRERGHQWSTIESLVNKGRAEKIVAGVYGLADRDPEQWESLAYSALRHPRSVVCLLSAARFHEMTTANTPDIWIALPHGSRRPQGDDLSLRVKLWRNPKLFTLG